jgi:hypothetical protein
MNESPLLEDIVPSTPASTDDALMPDEIEVLQNAGVPRREFIKMVGGAAAGLLATQMLLEQQAYSHAAACGSAHWRRTATPPITR